MKKYVLYLTLMLVAAMFNGCYYDVAEELYPIGIAACDTTNVTYTLKVLPVIQMECYSCHSGSAPSGNVNLDGFDNLKVYADNGTLMGAISHTAGYSPMPQGGNKLSDCDILTIQTWINKGTINN